MSSCIDYTRKFWLIVCCRKTCLLHVCVCLYYIEWAYQRSRVCHKCDVTTVCIYKPGCKCDVNLHLNPYIMAVDLDWFWVVVPNDIHDRLLHAMYTVRHLQWFLCSTCYVYWQVSPVFPLLCPLKVGV